MEKIKKYEELQKEQEKEATKVEPTELVISEQLPQNPIREAEDENGKYTFMTRDEALAELVVNTREILRRL